MIIDEVIGDFIGPDEEPSEAGGLTTIGREYAGVGEEKDIETGGIPDFAAEADAFPSRFL